MTATRRRIPGTKLTTAEPAPQAPEPVTLDLDGRLTLTPGREVTVRGLGRCTYHGRTNPDGSLDVWTARGCRSVMPDRVTKVHRTIKLKENTP